MYFRMFMQRHIYILILHTPPIWEEPLVINLTGAAAKHHKGGAQGYKGRRNWLNYRSTSFAPLNTRQATPEEHTEILHSLEDLLIRDLWITTMNISNPGCISLTAQTQTL
ncbi:hypothetical protein ACJX0J_023260 [Zea mays]